MSNGFDNLLDRPDDYLLTTAQVCQILSCTQRTVRELCGRRQILHAVRTTGTIRVRVGDLKTLIERRKKWTCHKNP